MNFLRSKITAYKQFNKAKATEAVSESNNQKKKQVFESIKKWDKQRADILKKHIQVNEQILRNLQTRVKNSQQYLLTIQGILKARLKELETYKNNSLNNSTFVLMNNHLPEYEQSYDLLKELVIFESHKQDKINRKCHKLKGVFAELCDFKTRQHKDFNNHHNNSQTKNKSKANESHASNYHQQQNFQLDESSVAMLKSNVRYLIDCQLPDIIEQTVKSCQQINRVYHNSSANSNEDLYILISKFLNSSQKQVQKHRQISHELLNLNRDFIQRQKKRSTKIKLTLSQWVKHDQNANQILIRQLQKQGNQSLIQDYYNINDMLESSHQQIKNVTIQQYLLHVSIEPFQRAQQLILYRSDAFYNKKIQTQVLITVDRYCHLRKPNQIDPEFGFLLTKQIFITQEEQFVFKIQKLQKKFMKSAQKQFQFCLEFNVGEDIQKLIQVLEQFKWANLKLL